MMTNVLINGANGQLGMCLQALIEEHHSNKLNFIFTTKQQLDITNKVEVTDFFNEQQINYCINCAAYTDVDKAEEDKNLAFSINAIGVKNLAENCKKHDSVLVHISTDYVFDGTNTEPYTETDTTNPINVYGASKLQGEEYIQEILHEFFIIRTSWLYSEFGNNFVKTILHLAKTKTEINVVNDQKGCPTYAKDLAEVILKVIKEDNTNYGIYHFSNKGETSWFGFAQEIFKQKNIQINLLPIASENYKTKAKRPMFSVLETNKIQSALNFEINDWRMSLKNLIMK